MEKKLTIQSHTGETYIVHKYILDNEGKQHVWCNDWYGHHVIGVDCEWVETGAGWVTGQYDRLYDQLKAEPERKIVCWVDYQWRTRNSNGSFDVEILRDICAIMGRVMGFNARGIGYGGAELFMGEEYEKKEFLEECERLHVQWLDECGENNLNSEITRRNKLLEDDLKRQCRLNMPGITDAEQEQVWQDYKLKHQL